MPQEAKTTVLDLIEKMPIKDKGKVYLFVKDLYQQEQTADMFADVVAPVKPTVHQGPPEAVCISCEG